MIRSAANRSLLRSVTMRSSFQQPVFRCSYTQDALHQTSSKRPSVVQNLALTAFRRQPTALTRNYVDVAKISRSSELEAKYREQVLEATPTKVDSSSSTMPVFSAEHKEEDADMMAGLRHDFKVIQDTFALNEVPVEAYRIGLAGVLPYLGTSAATVICALELNDARHHGGQGLVMSDTSAELLLQILEPLQVGYGAVILSFLGAIHWGLEWAKYGGTGGYRRYAIGVIAPAVAWPTILLPVEYALITQFLAFNILYTVDSHTTVRGWTPPWYSTYRFILTFIVGASIVLSLVARGQIVERTGSLPTAGDRIKQLTASHFGEKESGGAGITLEAAEEEENE